MPGALVPFIDISTDLTNAELRDPSPGIALERKFNSTNPSVIFDAIKLNFLVRSKFVIIELDIEPARKEERADEGVSEARKSSKKLQPSMREMGIKYLIC